MVEPPGGGGSDGCVRCYGTNVRPSLWSWLRPFTTAGVGAWVARRPTAQRAASKGPAEFFDLTSDDGRPVGGWGGGYEVKYTAKFRLNPPPLSPAHNTSRLMTRTACRSSEVRGLTVSSTSGRRRGWDGMAASATSWCSQPPCRRGPWRRRSSRLAS